MCILLTIQLCSYNIIWDVHMFVAMLHIRMYILLFSNLIISGGAINWARGGGADSYNALVDSDAVLTGALAASDLVLHELAMV